MKNMNRTLDAWALVKPDAFLTGSIVQARNIIEMMQQDIAKLGEERRQLLICQDAQSTTIEGYRAEVDEYRTEVNELCDALEWSVDCAASYFNICPDRSGKQISKLEEARAALAKARGESEAQS
jgi:hypothetical protein